MTTARPPSGDESAALLEVVEYTDPLCPWAWGAEPVFRRLRAATEGRVRWRRAFCILFDHDDDPAPDPAAETAWYSGYVEEIAAHTGAPRAARLSRVAASSWPAALVAKAAERQGPEVAERVLRRLRETVFVLGEPADTTGGALAATLGVPGLDPEVLAADAARAEVLAAVRADRAEARDPVPEARSVRGRSPHPGGARETLDGGLRYALPTLLFRTGQGRRLVPGWRPYEEYARALDELCPGLLGPAVPPAPAETALRRYGTLTGPEAAVLASGVWPPPGAAVAHTAGGPLWLDPEEAAVHPATRCPVPVPLAPRDEAR
ncbi:DsbA family protein [Streptomyces sp. J2-1]|uniref:DsbA family oxidoreductase n=1 Tax=Streptomyces corallincola TaxID=2851888 RepID=UPI001C3910CC|nr:DsbA family protein [Streptomyces corallincola]MBV2356742.1 DsbA family protein [Streptomyces corallincola]